MTDRDAGGADARYIRVGSLIAGYRLEERLGAGGMAVVYRAHDRRLDRLVALKILAPALASDSAFRERFIRESRAAAAVDDPHIIPVFQAGEAAGVLFIAMRYVRGGDIRSLIDRGPLPPGRVADMVSQVASALDAAHAKGLIHRDVKPANMLLEARPADDLPDHVYLSDFGLTKTALGTSLALTATGEFLGTLEYVSPEQIEGRQIDGRCDQYGLACSAFEMLCGQPPFRREQGLSVMYAHVHEAPPSILQFRPDLPAGAEPVLRRALAKAPADRYPSCGEFAAALRQALATPNAGPPWADAPQPDTEVALPRLGASATARPPAASHQDPAPGRAADLSRTQPPAQGPPTRPGLTDPSRGPESLPPGPHTPARRRWRSPARAAGVCVLALALAGGGYALATRGHPAAGHPGAGHPGAGAAALTAPGCTGATAPARPLTGASSASVGVPGAFGIAVSGRYAYVSGANAVTILRDGTARGAPTVFGRISVAGAGTGDAITHDGRYLLAAAGGGVAVISVARALDSQPALLGRLASPGGSGAVQVALSPDDNYAFVTLENSSAVAVFNLRKALQNNFAASDFVGDVPVGSGPNGLAVSGDSLYVANEGGRQLTVISMKRAERQPGRSAVKTTVPAGCSPARAMVAADGTLWVTATSSNALLGYSTAKLASDPDHALIARVRVGERPLGLTSFAGGSRIAVVDSAEGVAGKSSSIFIIDRAKAIAGQQSVVGYIPTGFLPRQVAVESNGQTLLVTVTNSNMVQAIDLGGGT